VVRSRDSPPPAFAFAVEFSASPDLSAIVRRVAFKAALIFHPPVASGIAHPAREVKGFRALRAERKAQGSTTNLFPSSNEIRTKDRNCRADNRA